MDNTEQDFPFFKRIIKNKAFIPVTFFLIIILLFGFTSRFSERSPAIETITPEIGNPGDVLLVTGTNFGDSRNGGEVIIAGYRPTTSSYIEWTDRRISVRIPQDVGSGMVFVSNRTGKSNGVLFTNRQHIPIILEGPAEPGQPYIQEITPSQGSVGTLVTLEGMNFGLERSTGKVYFTPIPVSNDVRRSEDTLQNYIAARECDYDYVSWSDTEIKIYVPDGSTSGNLLVANDWGVSNTVYFEVTEQAGIKLLNNRRGYQIQYGVQVFNVRAQPGNSLFLWVPELCEGLEQTNIEMIREPEPYWDTFPGILVYRLNDLTDAGRYTVSHTYWFDRYGVETKINSGKVVNEYDKNRKLYTVFTSPDQFIPSDDPVIQDISRSVTGREHNPYLKAKSLFSYVLRRYSYNPSPQENGVIESIEAREGNSYHYAVVLCALLRSAGVPSRPMTGYLVYDNKRTVKHYWLEFYLENFGWVPLDPALADGARFGTFPEVEVPEEYYFGNMDDQHVIFSRGILPTTKITPQGVVFSKSRMYSFQEIHEESTGNLESYNSIWQDMSVIDWW